MFKLHTSYSTGLIVSDENTLKAWLGNKQNIYDADLSHTRSRVSWKELARRNEQQKENNRKGNCLKWHTPRVPTILHKPCKEMENEWLPGETHATIWQRAKDMAVRNAEIMLDQSFNAELLPLDVRKGSSKRFCIFDRSGSSCLLTAQRVVICDTLPWTPLAWFHALSNSVI